RRATDGIVSGAAGLGRAGFLSGGSVAGAVALAALLCAAGGAVRQRQTRRRVVDSGGRRQRRLSGLLLLSAERRPTLAGRGLPTAAPRAADPQGSAAGAAGD